MRFQVNEGGWLIGATLIPASTVLDYADKPDHELTPSERVAQGRTPPLTATALDADAAIALHRAYPFHRERLRRHLDPFNEETFQKLLETPEAALEHVWGRK